MIKAAKAFGGAKAYDISIACPCGECDVRSPGCGRICSDYKKYKFVLTILKKNRQAKVRAASECRQCVMNALPNGGGTDVGQRASVNNR